MGKTDIITMPQIAARMFNTPLLVEPNKAAIIAQSFAPRLFEGAGPIELVIGKGIVEHDASGNSPAPMATLLGEEMAVRLIEARRGYVKHRGVAIISITGTLVRRGAYLGESSGETSYEGLRAQIKAAAADPDMKAIALEVDSHGGEAAGVWGLADLIREVRASKPVYAFLAENAHSAAYCLAAQANHITIPEFGSCGSIGVVMMHVDQSKALEQSGFKVTLIHSGDHKVDGNPFQALPKSVRDGWQSESDKLWGKFAATVEAGRGEKLPAAAALKTQAGCYSGMAAVKAGLADRVAEAKVAFDEMVEAVNEDGVWQGDVRMPSGPSASQLLPLPGLANGGLISGRQTALLGENIQFFQVSSPGCDNRAQSVHTPKESIMDDNEEQQSGTNPPAAGSETDVSVDASAQVAEERERSTKITKAVATAGLPASMAAEMIAGGMSVEAAALKIIDAHASAQADGGDIINRSSGRVTSDAVDRMKTGMTAALLNRAGMNGGERNEFSGMTLREMARETLNTRGLTIPTGGALMMVSAAFTPSMAGGLHSTSDFGEILADVANKSMLRGYQEAEETFELFTAVRSLSDFKPTKLVGMDLFPSLTEVAEGAEFKHGTMGDFAESMVLATYGRLFALTRQTIINDDLGAFTRVPQKMGRAARRTVGDLVFAVLNDNPNMGDGTTLFHADHSNLADSGGIPSEASINAGITAMSTQKDRSKVATALNIAPKFIIAGPTQRSAILQAMNSEYAPDDTSKAGSTKQPRAYNTVRDAAKPIFDARVSGNKWFLAADPNRFDTIEVAYLDGINQPFLEQQQGWSIDGVEWKVRLDAGVKATAWEGLYKDAGQ